MSTIGRRIGRLEQKRGPRGEFDHLTDEELAEAILTLRNSLAAENPDDAWIAEADKLLAEEAVARKNYPWGFHNPRPKDRPLKTIKIIQDDARR